MFVSEKNNVLRADNNLIKNNLINLTNTLLF